MTFLDLTRDIRWLAEAEAVLAELDGEAADPDERVFLDELRKTADEARSRLMPEGACGTAFRFLDRT